MRTVKLIDYLTKVTAIEPFQTGDVIVKCNEMPDAPVLEIEGVYYYRYIYISDFLGLLQLIGLMTPAAYTHYYNFHAQLQIDLPNGSSIFYESSTPQEQHCEMFRQLKKSMGNKHAKV